ncbi:MAG: glycosyltransferase family 2 protein, partial [bacterium]
LLSAVIVNWNTGALLKTCVASVVAEQERLENPGFEIILVDNASSDGSIRPVREAFSSVKIIENSENLGFARATNQGIRCSKGHYILLLNPDTEVRPQALDRLIHFLDTEPSAGAVGAMLLNPDGSLQISAYPEPTVFREAWRLFHLDSFWPVGSYRMSGWRKDVPRKVDVLMGACILVRKEALEQCGLLDESFFIYSEDQDLCRRLRSGDWGLFWEPRAKVVHHGGQSTRQVKGEMFLRLYREKVAYFRRHHGTTSAMLYKLVLLMASIVRQLLSPLAFLKGGNERAETFELLRHYRRLVRELPGF